MPRHSCRLDHTKPVTDIVLDVLEIHNPRIVVVLSREQRALKICRMHVGQRVCVGVPAPEGEVKAADTCAVVVHDNKL